MQIFIDDERDKYREWCAFFAMLQRTPPGVWLARPPMCMVVWQPGGASPQGNRGMGMTTLVRHRGVNIVVLEQGEQLLSACRAGDIGIFEDEHGWWIKFIGEDGAVDCYGQPYPSYNEALWTAKAAAEFGV
jgi:hypothetical protein